MRTPVENVNLAEGILDGLTVGGLTDSDKIAAAQVFAFLALAGRLGRRDQREGAISELRAAAQDLAQAAPVGNAKRDRVLAALDQLTAAPDE